MITDTATLRATDVHVRVHPLPAETGGGVIVHLADGSWWIIVDEARSTPERRVILHHELEHLARGSVRLPGVPPAVIEREEAAVRRTVTRRLVPARELHALVRAAAAAGEPITAAEVAAHFEVPVPVAADAWDLATAPHPATAPRPATDRAGLGEA